MQKSPEITGFFITIALLKIINKIKYMVEGKELLELMGKRQSDRGYTDKKVEKGKLDRILEAGRIAPSACNSQPWKFIVVSEPALVAKVAEATSAKALGMNTFVNQAPMFIIVVREKANISSRVGAAVKAKDYSLIDIGIATENICLQAAAEGLGTCIMGWFNEKLVKKVLQVPAPKRVELIISLGYSSKELRVKIRKPHEEVISYNSY
jgi:nitroreductase